VEAKDMYINVQAWTSQSSRPM